MKRIFSYFIIVVMFLLFANSFVSYAIWLNSENGLAYIINGRWDLVALNIIFFASFIFFLRFNKKADWYSSGVYLAFIISLFIEMYGFPLTVYFMSNYFGISPPQNFIFSFSFLGQYFALTVWTAVGIVITIVGIFLVVEGWREIYGRKNRLTTKGIYRFSRHPQYLGILLITFGWFIGWPVLLTFAFWPILLFIYYKQAQREDDFLAKRFGKRFMEYRKTVPMFI
jgi:protein-S-isoprenylcysteine O-methyltransferase Ste14